MLSVMIFSGFIIPRALGKGGGYIFPTAVIGMNRCEIQAETLKNRSPNKQSLDTRWDWMMKRA